MHLYEDDHYRNYLVVPESLTLQGISNKLECAISLVSRIVSENEKDGYIYRTKSKIINGKRKQYTFFLTEEGLKLAKEILAELSNPNLKTI